MATVKDLKTETPPVDVDKFISQFNGAHQNGAPAGDHAAGEGEPPGTEQMENKPDPQQDPPSAPEQKPPVEESPPATALIEVPLAEVPTQTWTLHVNMKLSPSQSHILRRIAVALDKQQATLRNGRRIVHPTDALRYILEQFEE